MLSLWPYTGARHNLDASFPYGKSSHSPITPTQMILELADLIDYIVDPRVPLILERPFLRMAGALIDVYGEELTLGVDDEAITFKYAQEVLGFSNSSTSCNPTPSLDPILSTSSPSLTPFEGGDFILEEIEACLTNDSIPPGIDDADFNPEGDIRLLEELLNNDPSSPLPRMNLIL
ncbi:hypothetical protein Tco_0824478 [Tanacetum coccineum]|uniref:Reverse transcriptase domain-containing protein n=1 Tax=Tanacetum coccineum TaxID=301880 RepID=A0ABQ5AQV9_9ASTR